MFRDTLFPRARTFDRTWIRRNHRDEQPSVFNIPLACHESGKAASQRIALRTSGEPGNDGSKLRHHQSSICNLKSAMLCWGARILAKPSLRENLGTTAPNFAATNSHSAISNLQCSAGVPGFEPGNDGSKGRCLTTWLHPSFRVAQVCRCTPIHGRKRANPIKQKAQFSKNRAKNIPKKGF